jgi:hypothetical protein
MRIFFHIGPHKTGTTSLQSFLRKKFGSVEPTPVWYPEPQRAAPGHADLAKRMPAKLGGSVNVIQDVVRQAELNNVKTLILSSENFSAITDTMSDYRLAMSGHDITLVSTQNSLILRAASRWQEWIKGRATFSFEQSIQRILESPGYQVDLIERFANGLNVKDIAIIYSALDDAPSVLIKRGSDLFETSCTDYLADVKNVKLNQKLGLIEAEVLRHLNELIIKHSPNVAHLDYNKMRNSLISMFKTPEWRAVNPHIEIENPQALTDAILLRAGKMEAAIGALRWPLREYGLRSSLSDLGRYAESRASEQVVPNRDTSFADAAK